MAVAGLVMYSENVHEIGFIENIKHAIEEQINPNSETNQVDATIGVDVTDIVNDDYVEHEHIWYEEYDETNHWKKCSICGTVDGFAEHTFTRTWTIKANSCYPNNYYVDTCECGYSHRGKIPHEWSGTWAPASIMGANYHDRMCSVCGQRIGDEAYYDNTNGKRIFEEDVTVERLYTGTIAERCMCKLADGSLRPCGSSQSCAICGGPVRTSSIHNYIVQTDNTIKCILCGNIRRNM